MRPGTSGLRAGDLDRAITIEVALTAPVDTAGQPIPAWTIEEADVPAQWLPGGTREAYQAQHRLASYVDGVYRIRDRDPRPTPDHHRIVGHDGRLYDVKPWIEDVSYGRDEALLIPVVARGEAA